MPSAWARAPNTEGNTDPFNPIFELTQPLSVSGLGGTVLNSVNFQLPDDASQGADDWYILNLTLEANVGPAAGPGAHNYVSVDTNGYTAAQIKFAPDMVAGQPAIRWSTFELFTGSASGVVLGRSVNISFRNYLQIRGVRPGTNDLTLRLEQPVGVVVSSVRLLPGSGVYWGEFGPSSLTLDVDSSQTHVEVGDMLSLRYRVSSHGFPVRDAGIAAITSDPGLVSTGPTSRFFEWLGTEEGRISFVALAPGKYTVTVEAGSETTFATATTNIDVRSP